MPRFLHTADWQIGRQYTTFDPEIAPFLAEARFTAVERLAQLATAHAVDAVLVAGDVFDAQGVSDKTIRRLFQAMQGFSGLWLLISGNHDAALAESVWTRAERLACVPANVQLLLAPQMTEFAAQGFAVLPAPLFSCGGLQGCCEGAGLLTFVGMPPSGLRGRLCFLLCWRSRPCPVGMN